MLSIQIINAGKSVQLDCDRGGLSRLIDALEQLKSGKFGHLHLRSPSAGGDFLSDKTPWGSDAVSEVVISIGGDD